MFIFMANTNQKNTKGYEDYLWEIDNKNPQITFAEFSGWMEKGELNEKKIVNVHNRAVKKAFEKGQIEEREKFIRIINKSNIINIGQKNNLKSHIKKQTKEKKC